MRCWLCGVEPLDVVDVSTLGDPRPGFVAARWPAGDHPHVVDAPTPEALLLAGTAAYARVIGEWLR